MRGWTMMVWALILIGCQEADRVQASASLVERDMPGELRNEINRELDGAGRR